MKKLILPILLLIIGANASAQFVRQSLGGSPTTMSYVRGVVKGDSSIAMASYPDTTTANEGPNVKLTDGLMIKVHDTIFVRDVAKSKWLRLIASGTNTPILFAPGLDSITIADNVICQYPHEGIMKCYYLPTSPPDTVIFKYPLHVITKATSGAAHDSVEVVEGGVKIGQPAYNTMGTSGSQPLLGNLSGYMGSYLAGVPYGKGTILKSGSIYYMCILDNTGAAGQDPTNTTYWEPMGGGGAVSNLQAVTNAGNTTTRWVLTRGLSASRLNFNEDSAGNIISTGFGGVIGFNQGNGEMYFQSSFASVTGGSTPSYSSVPLKILANGGIQFPGMGGGFFTGSPTYYLGVTGTGNVITLPLGANNLQGVTTLGPTTNLDFGLTHDGGVAGEQLVSELKYDATDAQGILRVTREDIPVGFPYTDYGVVGIKMFSTHRTLQFPYDATPNSYIATKVTVNGIGYDADFTGNTDLGTIGTAYTAGAGLKLWGNEFKIHDTADGGGTNLIWMPSKSAFRAGSVDGTQWNVSNIGTNSIALGTNNKASANRTITIGDENTSSGTQSFAYGSNNIVSAAQSGVVGITNTITGFGTSFAFGSNNTVTGYQAVALGAALQSKSFGGTVVGYDNDQTAAASATGFNVNNRAFQIGIGNSTTHVNAMTVLFSGKTTLNKYGVGSFTAGTPTYLAAFDASGNIMETSLVGGSDASKLNISDTLSMLSGYRSAINTNTTNIATNTTNIAAKLTGTYPNTTNKYLNGYGAFTTMFVDSISNAARTNGTNSFSGIQTISIPSIGAGTTNDGIVLANPTAAALGAQQNSPVMHLQGFGWGTTAGTSQSVDFKVVNAITQSTIPIGVLTISSSVAGSAYTNRLSIQSNNQVIAPGQIFAATGFFANMSGIAATTVDGVAVTNSTAATSGVPVQNSPRSRWSGNGWTGAASQQADWISTTVPVSGTSPITSRWELGSQINGGGFTTRFSITDAGNAIVNSTLGVGVTTNVASAIFQTDATNKGFLAPRMTKAQRDAIASPATGLIIWQTDNTPGLRSFNGTNWMKYTETID